MFSGGDLDVARKYARLVYCGNPYGLDGKELDEKCVRDIDERIEYIKQRVKNPVALERVTRDALIWANYPMEACFESTGAAKEGLNNEDYGSNAMQCVSAFSLNAKFINVTEPSLAPQATTAGFKGFNARGTLGDDDDYVTYIVRLALAGSSLAYVRLMPPDFLNYLESIRGKSEVLYRQAMVLYREAIDQAGVQEMTPEKRNAATQRIAFDIEESFVKPLVKKLDGVSGDTGKVSAIEKYIVGFYVASVKKENNQVSFARADDPLFAVGPLGLPEKSELSADAIFHLTRLFYEALMSYRGQPHADAENTAALAAKTAEAVGKKEKISKREVGSFTDSLMNYSARSVLDEARRLKEVSLDDADIGGVPAPLVDALSARNDDNKRLALIDFWNDEIEENETFKGLPDEKKGAARKKAADDLAKALKGKTAGEIALSYVESLAPDGTVAIKETPYYAWYAFDDGQGHVALLGRAREIYTNALRAAGKQKVPWTSDQIAKDVGKKIYDVTYFEKPDKTWAQSEEGLKKLLNASFPEEAFAKGKDGSWSLKDLEVPSKTNGLSFGIKNIAAVQSNGDFADYVEASLAYKWALSEKWSLRLGGAIAAGSKLNDILLPTNSLIFKPSKKKAYLDIGEANVNVGYKINDKHSVALQTGLNGSDYADGMLDVEGFYTYLFGTEGAAGSGELGFMVAFGRIVNTSTMNAYNGDEWELGPAAARLRVNFGILVHKGTKTKIGGVVEYTPVLDGTGKSTISGSGKVSVEPATKDKENSFPIEIAAQGAALFDTPKSWAEVSGKIGWVHHGLYMAQDINSLGLYFSSMYHYNSDFVTRLPLSSDRSFTPGQSNGWFTISNEESFMINKGVIEYKHNFDWNGKPVGCNMGIEFGGLTTFPRLSGSTSTSPYVGAGVGCSY